MAGNPEDLRNLAQGFRVDGIHVPSLCRVPGATLPRVAAHRVPGNDGPKDTSSYNPPVDRA